MASPEAAREGIKSIWEEADFIKVRDDEVAFLAHGDANDENNVLSLWYDGLKLLVVTDGKKGCGYFTKNFKGRENGFAVKTVDTTGAEDVLVGDFFLPYKRMKLTPHTDMTSFNSLMPKISQVCESVKSKRLQLIIFNKTTTTSTIIQSQMPHLDEWSALEVDYSTSLSGAITALQAASLRIPVNENVRVDIEELEGALNSASNVIETMSSHFQSFLPKKLPFTLVNPARGSGRDLDELQTEINVSCKKINKEFGYAGYEPIVYIDNPLSISKRIAFYSIAECVVVSTVRDGMNLTPYEYIVCRQGVSGLGSGSDSSGIKKSMLVVSEFVGCSPSLSGAIRINLWNIETIGETLNETISMEESEKQLLREKHSRYISTHDVAHWSRSFMQDLERSCKDHFRRRCYAMGIGFGFRLVALDANFKKLEISTIESA
ncbi:hypothetical protein GIB67_012285 [Kingdonia uniflora]|uniref:Carbohydrate kinase PfkB domain-containing protein n=1 Tax=Kingdonia uniflora TaxID=39325 RepID=A0A7J7LFX3_9MAGN|nr:hypothetical protein GIB67_012285 [Kingdonia uniflora]